MMEIRQPTYATEIFRRYAEAIVFSAIQDSPEIQEVCRIDYPVENLPAQRREAKWGFPKEEFFEGKYHRMLD
jgi:hypothetical protein